MSEILHIALSKLSKNANAVGEVLRDSAFDPDKHGGYGCYSTFNVNEAFEKVDPKSNLGKQILDNFARIENGMFGEYSVGEFVQDNPGVSGNLYSSGDVYMAWFWDGDGCLFFAIPAEGKVLLNTDCKKDYNWQWHDWKDSHKDWRDKEDCGQDE